MSERKSVMSHFMVAGFVHLETIVRVDSLPLEYTQFASNSNVIDSSLGGAGYNEAVALRWLGNNVDFMSMVGHDVNLRLLKAQTLERNVDLPLDYVLPILEKMPMAMTLYANDGTRQTFEDVKDARTAQYDEALYEERIQKNDMILISNCNFCRPILALAKKYNKPIALNVRSIRKEKTAQKQDFLRAADIIYISDDDVEGDPYDVIKECIELYDPEIIIMGIGKEGVILYEKKENSMLKYKSVKTNEVVNTMGAGNALFSCFLHYYVKTKDAREAIKNALLFASYKIGFVGTSNGFMTEEQIEQWKSIIWKE